MWPFETAKCLRTDADLIRRRSYGVIEIEDGQLRQILLRPWPKLISARGVSTRGARIHRHAAGSRVWLYYNQPRFHRNFLALKYVVSTRETTYHTSRASLVVLDEVARIKGSDAIVCQLSNDRLTNRFMERVGYESHFTSSSKRHYIRRFYGEYPQPARAYSLC